MKTTIISILVALLFGMTSAFGSLPLNGSRAQLDLERIKLAGLWESNQELPYFIKCRLGLIDC